jgi:hypothetical protein
MNELQPRSDIARGEAPRDLAAWTRWFAGAEIPVLPETAEALEACRANEDKVDANSLGEMISGDPLMTLKVLAYESRHRSRRVITSAETCDLGTGHDGHLAVLSRFGPQQTIDDLLGSRPEAMAGLQGVLQRAPPRREFRARLRDPPHRSGRGGHSRRRLGCNEFGRNAAVVPRPEFSPPGFRRCRTRIRAAFEHGAARRAEHRARRAASARSPNMSAAGADRRVDGGGQGPGQTSARIVALAARLARHTARGWDNAALPDDLSEIAALLNLSAEATLKLLMGI